MTPHASTPADAPAKAGSVDGLVRVSVGIETVGGLPADLEQALRKP
jgi:cystathionine beta-lyase/cystathionine gamma-synthase